MNQLSIAASLVDRLDVPTALRETVDHPCTLLPSRTAEEAVDSNFEDAVEYLNERLRSGTPVETAETLFVRKPHRGLRPVQAISFRQHLVFQALMATLTPSLDWRVAHVPFECPDVLDEGGHRSGVVRADLQIDRLSRIYALIADQERFGPMGEWHQGRRWRVDDVQFQHRCFNVGCAFVDV